MKLATKTGMALVAALLIAGAPFAAQANRGHSHRGPSHKFIRVHAPHVTLHHQWHRGHWHNGHHHGLLGWWWIVGPTWYWYPRAVYPYPHYDAPAYVAPPGPPPTQYWYFCESSQTYYPYVSSCPEAWKEMPATPGKEN